MYLHMDPSTPRNNTAKHDALGLSSRKSEESLATPFRQMRTSLLTVVLLAAFATASKSLVNEKVSRKIDLTTNIVRVFSDVTLRNDGNSPSASFDVAFSQGSNLADLEVQVKGQRLQVSKGSASDKG